MKKLEQINMKAKSFVVFNNILEDIDNYISYCTQHESVYINSKANAAIRNIKTTHDKCIRGEMDFL